MNIVRCISKWNEQIWSKNSTFISKEFQCPIKIFDPFISRAHFVTLICSIDADQKSTYSHTIHIWTFQWKCLQCRSGPLDFIHQQPTHRYITFNMNHFIHIQSLSTVDPLMLILFHFVFSNVVKYNTLYIINVVRILSNMYCACIFMLKWIKYLLLFLKWKRKRYRNDTMTIYNNNNHLNRYNMIIIIIIITIIVVVVIVVNFLLVTHCNSMNMIQIQSFVWTNNNWHMKRKVICIRQPLIRFWNSVSRNEWHEFEAEMRNKCLDDCVSVCVYKHVFVYA